MELSDALIGRFWAKVDADPGKGPWGDCYEWMGATISSKKPYGKLFGGNETPTRFMLAHRFAWGLMTGDWPNQFVLHKCDNHRCVRVEHLYEGTHQANVRDAVERKRYAQGESHGQARFTETEVREIRQALEAHSVCKVAQTYGVGPGHISMIKHRHIWKDV